MNRILRNCCILLLAALSVCPPLFGQGATQGIPPEIRRIMDKAKSGQPLTPEEIKELQQWGQSQAGKRGASGGDQSAKPASTTPAQPTITGPKRLTIPDLPTAPPSRDAYVAMATSTASAYAGKIGSALPTINAALEKAPNKTDGADLGAAFLMMGGGSAAVYSCAWSAVRQPDDALTASNLGAALQGIGDYRRALQALLYADKLSPKTLLILVNLGWFYFEIGDASTAKQYFERAAALAPDAAGPQLGLGLIAEFAGNHAVAQQYLRKALKTTYSSIGATVYWQAVQFGEESGGEKQGQESNEDQSLTEKEQGNPVEVPALPVPSSPGKGLTAAQIIKQTATSIDSRLAQLCQRYNQIYQRLSTEMKHNQQTEGNSVILPRDFDKELFLFEDTTRILFGKGSQYGETVTTEAKALQSGASVWKEGLPELEDTNRKVLDAENRLLALQQKYIACGNVKPCQDKVKAEMDAVTAQMNQWAYELCKKQKDWLDTDYVRSYKGWKQNSDGIRATIADYYSFTNPVLSRVWVSDLNDLMNVWREMIALTQYRPSVGIAGSLGELLKSYNDLKCVPPQPEKPVSSGEPELPTKEAELCPFSKPIPIKLLVVSVELSCDKLKMSAGEGLLTSFTHDFKKHETTYWAGVGAEISGYGLSASSKVGMEVRVSDSGTIQDVAVTTNLSGSVGTGELSARTGIGGRLGIQSGPSVSTSAGVGGSAGWGGVKISY